MIGGATSGTGGGALGRHLADVKGENVRTEMGESRHLGSDDLKEAVAELSQSVAGSGSPKPVYHLHADPAPTDAMSEDRWADYWGRIESEFGLQDQAFVEAKHWTWRTVEPHEATPEKLARVVAIHGPDNVRQLPAGGFEVLMEHRHRAYSREREDGSLVRLSHDHARREKVHRTFEHDHGFDLTKGAHNKAAAAALKADGRADVAAAIEAAGLLNGKRPRAATTPAERAQQERTGIRKADVETMARSAWASADSPQAREAAFAAAGLALAVGRDGKTPVLVDAAGGIHGLRRILGLKAKDAAAGIDGLKLPTADAVQTAIREAAKSPKGGGANIEQENTYAREAHHDGRTPHDIRRSQRDEEGHGENHRVVNGGRGQFESIGEDRRNPGGHVEDLERDRNAIGNRRANARTLEAQYVQRRGSSRIESLSRSVKGTARKAELKASLRSPSATASVRAAEARFASKGDMSRLNAVRVGNQAGGGSFGGGGGRSMDDIIKQQNGIQDASTSAGGGDGAPMAEGPDPEDLAKASEAFTEALGKLWRRFFGGKSESPPPHIETVPSPPGEGTGAGSPAHAAAAEVGSDEPPVPADPAAELGRSLAAYMRKVDKGTLKDGQKLADAIDRRPEGRKLRETIDAMHGDASLSDFAKRLPKTTPPSEIIRRIEQEAKRREQEARERQRERTLERTQVAKHGSQVSAPALKMGR